MPSSSSPRHRSLVLALFAPATIALIGLGCAESSDEPISTTKSPASAPAATGPDRTSPGAGPATALAGKQPYDQQCATCHGPTGLGDGNMAGILKIKPRSFVGEPWKYLDASSGETERSSMRELLNTGLPAAQMPAYDTILSDEQIDAVIEYVLHLRASGN